MNQLAKTAVKGYLLKQPLTWVFIAVGLFFAGLLFVVAMFLMAVNNDNSMELQQGSGVGTGGAASVSPQVSRWEPLVRKYAEENHIEKYTGVILALIQQETGGGQLDIMQSSESQGLPPGTITDPEVSIQVGVKYFAGVLKKCKGDIKLTLQSYNFGSGFINYTLQHGGYSKAVANSFSNMMAAKNGWSSYGDVNYVDHVLRYYNASGTVEVGSSGQSFNVQAVVNEMEKYLGMPYVWGGRSPSAGGFDCSGLVEYSFRIAVGKDLSGNAEAQYKETVPVEDSQAKPGDLIFFSTYKPGPSHVGMYVGHGQFLNANDNGIEYSSVSTWKKLYPYLGMRKVK